MADGNVTITVVDAGRLLMPEKHAAISAWPAWTVWRTDLEEAQSTVGIPSHFTRFDDRSYAIAQVVSEGETEREVQLCLFALTECFEGWMWDLGYVVSSSRTEGGHASALGRALQEFPSLVRRLHPSIRNRPAQEFDGHDLLIGAVLEWKRYYQWNERWDHDHCEICWAKFALYDDDRTLKSGYAIVDRKDDLPDDYTWICEECVRGWGERLNVKIKDGPPVAPPSSERPD